MSHILTRIEKRWGSRINIPLLSVNQCFYMMASIIFFTFSGLVGQMLAPDKSLSTAPISMIMIGAALMTIPASFLMHRFGRKIVFLTGISSGIISGIVGAYAIYNQNFSLFCLAGLFQGFYQAVAQYYRFAAMEATSEAHWGRAVSYVLAGGIGAALLAPMLANMANVYFEPVTFLGIYLLVACLGAIALVPACMLNVSKVEKPHVFGTQKARPMREIMKQPVFICAVVSAAAGYGLMSFVMTAAPLAIVGCGFGAMDAASVIQWHVLAMFSPSFFTGHIIQRFGVIRVLSAGIFLYITGAIVALSGLQLSNFGVALILVGAGWNFLYTSGTTLLASAHTAAEKAKIQGLNEFLVFVTTASASLSAGVILNAYGWTTVIYGVFGILSVVVIITGWYATVENRRRMSVARG